MYRGAVKKKLYIYGGNFQFCLKKEREGGRRRLGGIKQERLRKSVEEGMRVCVHEREREREPFSWWCRCPSQESAPKMPEAGVPEMQSVPPAWAVQIKVIISTFSLFYYIRVYYNIICICIILYIYI